MGLLLAVCALAAPGGCSRQPPRLVPSVAEPIKLPPALAEERVVPGTGENVPPGHPDTSFASNCAGQPCRGYCVLNTRTEVIRCRCFGQEGGCSDGLICCKAKGGCATPEECYKAGRMP